MRIQKGLLSSAPMLLALGIQPAAAFDCAKAQSTVEKAICADEKLAAADDAMAAAYAGLRNSLNGPDRKALGASQSKWVKDRETRCGYQEGAERTTCILTRTEERRRLLLAKPESGPGASSRMMPVFIQRDGDRHHFDIDYTLIRFVEPKTRGENLFNAEINKLVRSAPTERQNEAATQGMTHSAYASMALTYASPDFISAKVETWEFTGGAHGNSGTSAINMELRRGEPLKSQDLFDNMAIATLKTDCAQQIMAQKKEKLEGEDFNPADDPFYQEQTVVDHLRSFGNWSFWKGKATVTFDAYSIGSYAEGTYECEFSMMKLKSLAKPGALLPE